MASAKSTRRTAPDADSQRTRAHESPHDGTSRVLHHGSPSVRPRFSQPVVGKQGDVFLLCTPTGEILPHSEQGIYFHDMRHLSGQTIRLSGETPVSLLATAADGAAPLFELTNPDLTGDHGELVVRKEALGIRVQKRLDVPYRETYEVVNYLGHPVQLSLALEFAADFASMFAIRGAAPGTRGDLHPPQWRDGETTLLYQYDGADNHLRTTSLHFDPKPERCDGGRVEFDVAVSPGKPWRLELTIELLDRDAQGAEHRPNGAEGIGAGQLQWVHEGVSGIGMGVQTSSARFNEVLARSFQDLHMLSMRQHDDVFFAAGVPWYVALFGRDSLVTAIQMVAFEPDIAAETLRVLASRQATRVDDWRDEQPGKILHELRVGEMANLGEIPQTPYFGSVDSTPLFLILTGIHATWSGTLELFHELKENIDRALAWIDDYGDSDGDGYVDYQTRSTHGLRNQGWKDSGNGIVMEDRALAEPPIALPEVQGDVYLAWRMMADLCRRDGDEKMAADLAAKADDLYERFNRDFWLPEEGYYAFCKQADGRFSRSIASNSAHALWTGIIDEKRAGQVVERVMQPDMFSGWGIRTLSTEDASYNPIDYQVGSVWPHDNAIIVSGMQRYGYSEQASRVFSGMVTAATSFRHSRLPETFAGFARPFSDTPVRYPVACNPQAWAAGTIPYMLRMALGLQPDAFNRALHIDHPWLPDWLDWVTVHELKVGQDSVDLRYERSHGETLVAVRHKSPGFRVSVRY